MEPVAGILRAMSQENVEVVRRIWDIYMDGFERGDPRGDGERA